MSLLSTLGKMAESAVREFIDIIYYMVVMVIAFIYYETLNCVCV